MRLKNFSQLLIEHGLDAYLVIDPADIFYLTGYLSSGAWLLVMPKRAYYLTDKRYSEEARQALGRRVMVRVFKKSLEEEIAEIFVKDGAGSLGCDEYHFFVARLKRLKTACAKTVRIVPVNGIVAKMRMIKDEAEIGQIRECIAVNQQAYGHLKRILRPGMTERQVFWKLEDFTRRKNVGFAFDPIIASGPNSAFPHASVSDRIIKNIDIVLIDLGIRMNGYNSDLTRIFLSDKIAHPFREVYQAVAEAQEMAIARIRSGVLVAEVDQAARKSLRRNKLEKFFTHGLGHGVGIGIHEAPRLSVKSAEILQAGMVVTVEPGVYFPGKFGIRIEDMVLVTEKGCEVLSRGSSVEGPWKI